MSDPPTLPGELVLDLPTPSEVLVFPAPGPPGQTGPAGGTSIQLTAGAVLSGHRLVTRQADGTAVYADNTTVADISAPLWLTLGSALSGAQVDCQALGVVDEPSWSWTPGPLYLGANGVLVQSVPAAPAFLCQVGYATSPTSIVLNRYPSIRLV